MSEISNIPELSSQTGRMSIPGLAAWLCSEQGRYIMNWEQACCDATVADIFGYNALQIGLPQYDLLQANRIPFRQKAGTEGHIDTLCEPTALPFSSKSIDLVVLPHILEFSPDPHQILREVERILIPEGQLIITGFNPYSTWGIKQKFNRSGEFPWAGNYLSIPRLSDWLQLLGFELDRGTLGCYAPPVTQRSWLQRWQHIESTSERWLNFSGAVYVLHAIKRTHGMRLITPNWKKKPARGKVLRPIAQKEME
jgi:SAM-dependent methyltransferase